MSCNLPPDERGLVVVRDGLMTLYHLLDDRLVPHGLNSVG